MTKEKDRRRDWISCSRAERWRREEESMKRKQEGREGRREREQEDGRESVLLRDGS